MKPHIILLLLICPALIGADATEAATVSGEVAKFQTITNHYETRAGLGGSSPFEKFYPTTLNYGLTVYCADTNLCYHFRQKPEADGTWTLDWVKVGKP